MILVTGATGTAGSEVVRALLDRGRAVRVFVRDPDRARSLFGDAVQIAPGDFADPRSVRVALEGVAGVVLSGADHPDRVKWETGAIDAAVAAGVRRIVRLSSIQAEPGAPVAFWDWHGRIDQHLRGADVCAVILQSGVYMSNVEAAAAHVALEGRLYAPAGEARMAMIDPRDVGAAAAAAVTTTGRDGRTHVLTGPKAVTYAQIAEVLSTVTGHAVEFVDVPDAAANDQMIGEGVPETVAGQIVKLYGALRQGVAEQVTTTVETLTGLRPRDFAAYARDHADLFAPITIGAGR